MDSGKDALHKLRIGLLDIVRRDGPQRLLHLTDEELTAADPRPDDTRLVITPHLDDMTREQREWVAPTALRSLVARELVQIGNVAELEQNLRAGDPPDQREVEVDMRLAPQLHLVLTLRATADRILVVHQTHSAGQSHSYLYVHGDGLVLDEHVTSGGMHTYTLLTQADAARVALTMTDPLDAAGRDGDPVALALEHFRPGAESPLAPVVASALVATRLLLLAADGSPGHGRLITAYASSDALWLVQVDAPHDPKGIRAQEVSGQTVGDVIVRVLSGDEPVDLASRAGVKA